MPEPVIRAHILSAGLDPSIVLSNPENNQQEVPITFLQELQKRNSINIFPFDPPLNVFYARSGSLVRLGVTKI